MLLIYFHILTEAHLRRLQEYHCNGSSAGKKWKIDSTSKLHVHNGLIQF